MDCARTNYASRARSAPHLEPAGTVRDATAKSSTTSRLVWELPRRAARAPRDRATGGSSCCGLGQPSGRLRSRATPVDPKWECHRAEGAPRPGLEGIPPDGPRRSKERPEARPSGDPDAFRFEGIHSEDEGPWPDRLSRLSR